MVLKDIEWPDHLSIERKGNCKSWSAYLWKKAHYMYFIFTEIQISPKEEMEVNSLLLIIKVTSLNINKREKKNEI